MKRIVFLGTPEFAVPTLETLAGAEDFQVVAAISQPDRAKDRKGRLLATPVRQCAEKLGIQVLQFDRLKKEGVETLRALAPDLMVTAAYGQLLSQEILDIPPYGVLNVHGSLLPAYRGAAPVQWAIINGETETGVSIMKTELGMDTGPVIKAIRIKIGETETYGELLSRLAVLGAEAILPAVRAVFAGEATFTAQNQAESSSYPMLKKTDAALDFTKSARTLFQLIRGTNPWPCAYALLDGQPFKVWQAALAEGKGAPGELLCADEKLGLTVACGEGALRLVTVQAAGGKKMSDTDFLRGRKIAQGSLRSGV